MSSLKKFELRKIDKIHEFKGGLTYTDAGKKVLPNGLSFNYGFDTTTWTEGATEWVIKYYNVDCGC